MSGSGMSQPRRAQLKVVVKCIAELLESTPDLSEATVNRLRVSMERLGQPVEPRPHEWNAIKNAINAAGAEIDCDERV